MVVVVVVVADAFNPRAGESEVYRVRSRTGRASQKKGGRGQSSCPKL